MLAFIIIIKNILKQTL